MTQTGREQRKANEFSKVERDAVYRAIFERRDVRSQFLPDEIPHEILGRILMAAHHAPSVGFMQPWEFILIRSRDIRTKVHESFTQANAKAAAEYGEQQQGLYRTLRLEGILSTPLNLCVTCNRATARGSGLGRKTIPETDLYSCVCAVENLLLAARAEGIGAGWVSILSKSDLKQILRLPEEVEPIAYLCLGYVSEFASRPDLEVAGWEKREALQQMLYFDHYGERDQKQCEEILPLKGRS